MTKGEIITADDGEAWRVVSVEPVVVLRRCWDGKIAAFTDEVMR